jgi:hypothetical protein
MKIAAALLVLSMAQTAAADVRVTPLVRDGRVWVSFGVDDGLTPDLHQAVLSGLPVSFTYDVELRRGVAFWLDRVLNTVTIGTTVTFDTLTRRHEANTEYYVRVRARVKPHGSLIVWPWDSGLVSTNVNFTFIP